MTEKPYALSKFEFTGNVDGTPVLSVSYRSPMQLFMDGVKADLEGCPPIRDDPHGHYIVQGLLHSIWMRARTLTETPVSPAP